MNHQQMLQALATLDPRTHAMQRGDAHDIDLWLKLSGLHLDMSVFSDKTLENIRACYDRYFV